MSAVLTQYLDCGVVGGLGVGRRGCGWLDRGWEEGPGLRVLGKRCHGLLNHQCMHNTASVQLKKAHSLPIVQRVALRVSINPSRVTGL